MKHKLPKSPYKGISYYGAGDTIIFAARDEDILTCSHILGNPATRILLLHGRTGCGKSSFLRAGLLPFLERQEHSFQFLQETKQENSQGASTLFIRCTAKPLERLAERIYLEVTSKRHEIRTPDGQTMPIDLTSVLVKKKLDAFIKETGENPQIIVRMLSKIASLLPRTLVVVIDQAEEVLTVKQDEEGRKWRDQFFDFMALFSRSQVDLKLLIALRTEWYGQFYNTIRKREWDSSNIRDYLLDELTKRQIVQAINHPTKFKAYNFSYQKGLPEKIAEDLKTSALQGGILPVMQIICGRLYHNSRETGNVVITRENYSFLGGVGGQLDGYLRETFREMFKKIGLPSMYVESEMQCWGEVLGLLVRTQIDGTVTTDLKSEKELKNKWREVRCKINFKKAVDFLSDEKRRILQKTEIFNPQTRQTVIAYSLGHDAIGLAVKRYLEWEGATHSVRGRIKKRFLRLGLSWGGAASVLGLLGLFIPSLPSWVKWVLIASILYSISFIIFSFLRMDHLMKMFGILLPSRSRKKPSLL